MSKKFRLLALALAVLMIVPMIFAGCSNDDKKPDTTTPASQQSTSAPSTDGSQDTEPTADPNKIDLEGYEFHLNTMFYGGLSSTEDNSHKGTAIYDELMDQLKLYGILLLSLLVFALSIGRRADRPDYLVQTPPEKRKLRKRTILATLLILLLIPLTLFIGVYLFGGKRYYFISLLILLECMLPFFLIFEGRKPQARELVLIAVLVALNVAGRAVFFMLPEFKPVVAMTILAGVAFGGETGFLVGAMTM